jgi:hypothetical protein
MVSFRRRLLALLVPLTVVAVLAATAIVWLDQQSARARLAEAQLEPALARAEAAEVRAVRAEASLTAIAQQRIAEAGATATVVARVDEPRSALRRNLQRLFGVFQDPVGTGFQKLPEAFSEGALQTLSAEANYLRANGRYLGGASTFTIDASAPEQIAPDRAQVHTVERWLYDERDEADQRFRCFVEDSDQTYVLRLTNQVWIVDEVRLGQTRRSDCPPGP